MIQAYTPINIRYEKDSGEVSTRTIIPTITVPQNIRAVDVTQLSEDGRTRITNFVKEYSEYVHNHLSSMFSLQDWIEHTSGEKIELSWRTFKRDNTTIID